MLHIAPETALAWHIRRKARFEYRSADQAMATVDDQIDITHMGRYKEGAFDCFICSHVLEHVEDDRAALCELFRILAPVDGVSHGASDDPYRYIHRGSEGEERS